MTKIDKRKHCKPKDLMVDVVNLLKTNPAEYFSLKRKRLADLKEKHQKERREYVKQYAKHGKGLQINSAKQVVHWMLKAGTLVKSNCFQCGEIKTEAHHVDYSKPYKVMWLCKRCHVDWHKDNKPKYVK